MKSTIIALAVLAAFIVALNITAFVMAILFSNWITGTITFMGVVLALCFALYKIIEQELTK